MCVHTWKARRKYFRYSVHAPYKECVWVSTIGDEEKVCLDRVRSHTWLHPAVMIIGIGRNLRQTLLMVFFKLRGTMTLKPPLPLLSFSLYNTYAPILPGLFRSFFHFFLCLQSGFLPCCDSTFCISFFHGCYQSPSITVYSPLYLPHPSSFSLIILSLFFFPPSHPSVFLSGSFPYPVFSTPTWILCSFFFYPLFSKLCSLIWTRFTVICLSHLIPSNCFHKWKQREKVQQARYIWSNSALMQH